MFYFPCRWWRIITQGDGRRSAPLTPGPRQRCIIIALDENIDKRQDWSALRSPLTLISHVHGIAPTHYWDFKAYPFHFSPFVSAPALANEGQKQ